MSRKKSRRAPSPMEQGELDEESPVEVSPELRLEADDSHFSAEEEEEEEDRRSSDEDGEEESRSRKDSPDRSEDDTLDIKPPQQNSGKRDKHKKKHKEDRKRERDKVPKEGERSKHGSKEVDKERLRGERRERERGGNERERDEFRQKEERRRLKSLKERERLERLERERHRIDRDRQRREQEHRDQLRKQEREKREREKERLERTDKHRRKEDEKRRRERPKQDFPSNISDERQPRRDKDSRRVENRGDERIVQRSRSPYDRDRREKDRDRYRERERGREKYDDRQTRQGRDESPSQDARNGASSNKDKSRQRRVEYEEQEEDDHQDDHHDDEYQRESLSEGGSVAELSAHSEVRSEAASVTPASVESRTESEDSESDSHSETDHERHEDDQERTPEYKRRSKFEDESEKESETESVHQSNEEIEEEFMDETPPASPVELKPVLPPYLPAIQGCRPVDEFQCLNRIEEGTYGVVYRAVDKKTGEVVALKKLKMEKEKEGFPITSLREINTLLKAQHVNIVTVREIVVGSNMDKIFIVMDYVEHDMKSLMETMKEPFITGEVKTLMIQLLRGVAHLHDNWIVHRDLKTSNLLLSHKGILKIGDFGLAREYGSPLKQYTPIVVTLWYRAPELLLGTKLYSVPIDMWSCGCIFAEFLTRKPLFPGKSEIDQLNKIFKELGTPNEKIWSGVSELPAMKKCTFADHPYNQLRNKFGAIITERGFDLMNRFLTYNPERRITAEAALKHEYFVEAPVPVDPSMFPTWPAKSEQPRRTHGNSPKPPSGGKAFSKLLGDDDHVAQSGGGFHLGTATKGASAAGAGFALKFGP